MKVKGIVLTIAIAGGIGFAAAYAMVGHSFAKREAAWQADRDRLENALAAAQGVPVTVKTLAGPAQIIQVTNIVSPEEIVERLMTMKAATGDPRSVRLLLHQFESLIAAGPAALPAIRNFLQRNQDAEYDVGFVRGGRDGNIPLEFSVPPSLRLGLLEAAKRIGGDSAEQLLAETLKTTGRGIEVAYLARALQQMAPDKYRSLALASARELLTSPLADPSDPLGKYDRNYLFGVFILFNDNSIASLAQSQVVLTNGQLDSVALRYLQQTMSSNTVPMVSQLYQDPRIAADQKEPLARAALTYAGLDERANQLIQAAINDPHMPADARRNLIEDLNETGFPDPKHLTDADAPLIRNRIALIERLAAGATDPVNIRAFQEAYKDLNHMLNQVLATNQH
jgi:hypothetical protein